MAAERRDGPSGEPGSRRGVPQGSAPETPSAINEWVGHVVVIVLALVVVAVIVLALVVLVMIVRSAASSGCSPHCAGNTPLWH